MAGEVFRFSKHKGKTLEWVTFNDPGFIVWIMEAPTTRKPRTMGAAFDQLVYRASHLRIPGGCMWGCGGKPITRMCLHEHPSGGLGAVGFDCDTCEPDNRRWIMIRPSLLASEVFRRYDKTGGKMLVSAIRSVYELPKVLRQPDMEIFFANDTNFNL